MTFEELLDQAIAMLRRRGRVTYRTLKLQFNLDDDHLEALKELTFPFYDLCAARPQRWRLWDRYGHVRGFALLLLRDAHADHRRNLPSLSAV